MKNLREILIARGFNEQESNMKGLWFFRKENVRISLSDETIYVKVIASVGYKEKLNKLYNPFELERATKDLENAGIK